MSREIASIAQSAHDEVVRYVVNKQFNQAVLFLRDGSHLQFEHTSRSNRWARASKEGGTADALCRQMTGFRLNAIHLQLYFEDDSTVEFKTDSDLPDRPDPSRA